MAHILAALMPEFQSTPSARRATMAERHPAYDGFISIHALREESDRRNIHAPPLHDHFNPRPPRGERRCACWTEFQKLPISIHALREEGNTIISSALTESCGFQSTPSARRATHAGRGNHKSRCYFNPRPPRGGRLCRILTFALDVLFQSTPSARRATPTHEGALSLQAISIHALREESDNRRIFVLSEPDNFNPRPPRGERLHTIIGPRLLVAISIHALREEGDIALVQLCARLG